jgi:hypothetical protein
MCDLHLEARDPKLGRDTPPCDVMIHVAMKFRQIIFSGSEVTVRTNNKCDVRTYVRTDRRDGAQYHSSPLWAGANKSLQYMHVMNSVILSKNGQTIKDSVNSDSQKRPNIREYNICQKQEQSMDENLTWMGSAKKAPTRPLGTQNRRTSSNWSRYLSPASHSPSAQSHGRIVYKYHK